MPKPSIDLTVLQSTPPWEWPRDAGKLLGQVLSDRGAGTSDRVIAADLAGNLVVINDVLAKSLMAVLQSPDEADELRATAAISFGPVLEQGDTMEFDVPEEVPISEGMFHNIQEDMAKLYADSETPKEVRRRIMEASVRAPDEWHQRAIQEAYSSGDREWMLTAVFAMRYLRGFNDQILEALESGDAEIHEEAILAAGNWEMDGAWPHVLKLLENPVTPKPLLLGAIDAAASIRPQEAGDLLEKLADSEDEEIAEAADEARQMAVSRLRSEDEEAEEIGDPDIWVN